MSDPEQILATLRAQRSLLSRRYPIRRLALFGSWARGDAREDSDVDVMVDVDPSIGLRFVDLGLLADNGAAVRLTRQGKCVADALVRDLL